jgi:LPXTG-motif cell wall-anchored protein
MKRFTVAVAVVLMMVLAAVPASAQESPVDEVAPIVIDRPPARVAVPPAVSPGAVAQQPTAVRAAGAGQLAQTGVDTATAAGMAALLFVFGAAALTGARRKRLQAATA